MLNLVRERLQKAIAAAEADVAAGAITIALDIEVFTYEANILLNALSLMSRLTKE